MQDIFGFVVDFAGDQQGSRFLQEKIPGANSDDKSKVFDEIIVNANQMMTDVFGNYIIQKLFEYGTLAQKRALAYKMQGNVVDLSVNIYGCRCVQEVSNLLNLASFRSMLTLFPGPELRPRRTAGRASRGAQR